MRVLLTARAPRGVGDNTLWIALATKEIGRGPHSAHFVRASNHGEEFASFYVAACIIANQGHLVSSGEILDYVYGHDPDGGPDTGSKVLDVHCYNLREKLKPIGIGIVTTHGQGRYAVLL